MGLELVFSAQPAGECAGVLECMEVFIGPNPPSFCLDEALITFLGEVAKSNVLSDSSPTAQ